MNSTRREAARTGEQFRTGSRRSGRFGKTTATNEGIRTTKECRRVLSPIRTLGCALKRVLKRKRTRPDAQASEASPSPAPAFRVLSVARWRCRANSNVKYAVGKLAPVADCRRLYRPERSLLPGTA